MLEKGGEKDGQRLGCSDTVVGRREATPAT